MPGYPPLSMRQMHSAWALLCAQEAQDPVPRAQRTVRLPDGTPVAYQLTKGRYTGDAVIEGWSCLHPLRIGEGRDHG